MQQQQFVMLPGASSRRPLQQGNLTNLCGLYSVVNAVQLALYPRKLSASELSLLIQAGIKHLSAKRVLHEVIREGMYARHWVELMRTITKHVEAIFGAKLMLRRPICNLNRKDLPAAFQALQDIINDGCPVLVSLEGAYGHYTVISGYSSARLYLFDSSGGKWISKAHCGLLHDGRRSTHKISRTRTIAICHG
nr:hypothetical protein [uncultured Sphingomonas sp.]